MIVIIGSPTALVAADTTRAAGIAVGIGRSATAGLADVQIVGRVGDDATGDAVLLDLAAARIGHVALLRTPGAETSADLLPTAAGASRGIDFDATVASALDDEVVAGGRDGPDARGLPIDGGDLDLALRYLPDYRVLVVADDLGEEAWKTVAEAVGWSGAAIIAVVVSGAPPSAAIPDDATVLERPGDDADGAFAGLVGRYAAELDRGTEPRAAFAAATADAGWATVEGEPG